MLKNYKGHKPSGDQIVKSHKKCFIMLSCWISSSNGLVSVYLMKLRHVFFANSIFNFIISDY